MLHDRFAGHLEAGVFSGAMIESMRSDDVLMKCGEIETQHLREEMSEIWATEKPPNT
jgi:hypothetical protein